MKKINVDELVEMGLLFEINRAVLHPLGLALEVIVQEDGTTTFGKVWDARDDPEGWIFGKEAFDEGMEKFTAFMEEIGKAALNKRLRTIGFIHQSTGEQGEEG